MTKLCIECAHYRAGPSADIDRCDAPQNVSNAGGALVRGDAGKPIKQWLYCESARGTYGSAAPSCGPDGKWFTAAAVSEAA